MAIYPRPEEGACRRIEWILSTTRPLGLCVTKRPEHIHLSQDKGSQTLVPCGIKRIVGGDSRKFKSPLAVAVSTAPSHVRRTTHSEDFSEAMSRNTNSNGLTPYILRNVSYMRQGKRYTSPHWMTMTNSENTGDMMVGKINSMVARKSAGGFCWARFRRRGAGALSCRDRRTLSCDRSRSRTKDGLNHPAYG